MEPGENRVGGKVYNRLAIVRNERGLDRDEVAEVLSIDYQKLGYIERGVIIPDLELTLRISEFFGLPVEQIFGRKPFGMTGEERDGHLV